MPTVDGLKVEARVTFEILGIKATTGKILTLNPNGQATVHPDGYKDSFSVMVPQESLCLVPEEEPKGETGDDLPAFTGSVRKLRKRRKDGKDNSSPYFVR